MTRVKLLRSNDTINLETATNQWLEHLETEGYRVKAVQYHEFDHILTTMIVYDNGPFR